MRTWDTDTPMPNKQEVDSRLESSTHKHLIMLPNLKSVAKVGRKFV